VRARQRREGCDCPVGDNLCAHGLSPLLLIRSGYRFVVALHVRYSHYPDATLANSSDRFQFWIVEERGKSVWNLRT
jgi:hypothetical protein